MKRKKKKGNLLEHAFVVFLADILSNTWLNFQRPAQILLRKKHLDFLLIRNSRIDLMLKNIVATIQTVMGSSLSQQSAVETVSQWRSKPSELIFDSGRREISQYMQAVDRLQQSGSNDKLISTAMDRLRSEFVAVLSRQADHHAGPISTTECSSVSDSTAFAMRFEDYVPPEPPSNDVITYLRSIAERMNASKKIGDCVKVYKSARKSSLQSQLRRLRFDELTQLSGGYNARRYMSDELKVKMELWIEVSKICVKILFEREKKLCDEIFQELGNGSAKNECFVGTVKDFAVGLFGFAEAISLSRQPYDKMGAVLGVYDAFFWVLPSANELFKSENGRGIRDSIAQTLLGIENDVERMMIGFQSVIFNEISNVSDERGGVHRSTEHVMDQISVIVRNKELLTRLIKRSPSLEFGDLFSDYRHNRSFLELHLILIIEVLHKNLQKKSKSYEDSCLGQVFMMNNVRFILQRIESSAELKQMIGDHYLTKVNDYLKAAMTVYQSTTCNRFLNCFQEKGLYINGCFKSRPSRRAIRRRLGAFNGVFDEVKDVHSSWRIVDVQLREKIRVSMSAVLVPSYQNFLEKFESDADSRVILEKNIKYSDKDLEALILENLFGDD